MNTESRRHFLRTSGAVVGATLVPSVVYSGRAYAAAKQRFPKIWNSADVLIGSSPAEQNPSPVITCPFFFPSGHFADGFHTLDLSALPGGPVKGNLSWGGDTISPDFSRSLTVSVTQGTDGNWYLLTAGEARVSGGEGLFNGVTQAIVRCKYKVSDGTSNPPLLMACINCVAILVRR